MFKDVFFEARVTEDYKVPDISVVKKSPGPVGEQNPLLLLSLLHRSYLKGPVSVQF